ncbi:dynein axonemal assembly factor 1 [Nematostella vectensis]|uniref:dynein axonemal assembly factor 1 n=1 Tax=Nematostella vectensis TaxID=45351 RepID=UPI0020770152|nr:dynein axonemal assembly factor 1 [Nematostella vectensis]
MPENTSTMGDEKAEDKFPRMTKKALKQICKDQKLYLTPHLNDILYLHFRGFGKIENLEEYTGVKCLWLECNGIEKIENLGFMKELKCLYLQQNMLKKVENLEELDGLDTLNVSNNIIRSIENIACLPVLNTLQIAHNRLASAGDIKELASCQKLSIVDLSYNKIDDPNIVDVLAEMPNLSVLNLIGNPVIKKIKNYRKNMILKLKNLKYLDDRPVFPRERACTEAWAQGGPAAEKEERERWINKERQKMEDGFNELAKLRKGSLREKEDLLAEEQYRKEEMAGTTDEDLLRIWDEKPVTSTRPIDENIEIACKEITEEMETITIRPQSTPQGIFGSRPQQQRQAGPLLSEIVSQDNSESQADRVLITEMRDEDGVETITLGVEKRKMASKIYIEEDDNQSDIDDLPDLEDVDVTDPLFVKNFTKQEKPLFTELKMPLEIQARSSPLIQELDTPSASNNKTRLIIENITHTSPHARHEAADHPTEDSEDGVEGRLHMESAKENSLFSDIQRLAATVGSTIDREPLDINREKRAFQRKARRDSLDGLD